MLPTPQQFMENMGLGKSAVAQAVRAAVVDPQGQDRAKVRAYESEEFRRLLVNYCATLTDAFELEGISWVGLSRRLGTRIEHLKEAADQLNHDGSLWQAILAERIRRASADKIFRDLNWESLENMAQAKLIYLLERGLIKDVGELLAVASTSRRSVASAPSTPQGGTNVAVTVFNGTPGAELPAAGAQMTIDLSPRTADALARARERAAKNGERVIDGEMLTASELRELLVKKEDVTPVPVSESEAEPAQPQPQTGE